jgi:hypothetical protein
MAKRQCQKDPAGLIGLTDRKSLGSPGRWRPESVGNVLGDRGDKSQAVKTPKLRPIFLFMPER